MQLAEATDRRKALRLSAAARTPAQKAAATRAANRAAREVADKAALEAAEARKRREYSPNWNNLDTYRVEAVRGAKQRAVENKSTHFISTIAKRTYETLAVWMQAEGKKRPRARSVDNGVEERVSKLPKGMHFASQGDPLQEEVEGEDEVNTTEIEGDAGGRYCTY